jgi:glycosyltransferase involved in cell wall biosynthesis
VKIAMLSDHEALGGAAQSASRLAAALSREHQVIRLVLFPDGKPHPWQTHVLGTESRVARWATRIPRKLRLRGFPYPHTEPFAAQQLLGVLGRLCPDVVNVHNLHGGTDWGWTARLAGICADVAPSVWTLHDMWSFTGRCAYAYDCEKFRSGCDATCPTPHEAPRLAPEHIAAAWNDRRRWFTTHPELVAVTPSRWLAAEAQRGLWAGHSIEVISYSVPTDVFFPLAREQARERLGIPTDSAVLLLAAYDVTERRKGAELLPHLWRHVRRRPLTVVTMGHGRLEVADPSLHVRALGWIDDDRTKALAYSAADAVLHPAPVDNFPNVLLEGFACGTPAIGMPVGGVPELIRPGISGWLAAEPTADALGRTIDAALDSELDLRESCRALAEADFAMALQAQRYTDLFSRLRVSG